MKNTKPIINSRGYLPHLDLPNVTQFITIRLADSLPTHVLDLISSPKDLENFIDAGHGSCYLKTQEISEIIFNSLKFINNSKGTVHAWVIMPNHIHFIISLFEGENLSETVKTFKSYTARIANKILNRTGNFWYPDYFDRYIRNDEHFDITHAYILTNPVRANLCKNISDWKFSSANMSFK